MRKILLCILAVMLWSQAVDALECYYCPNGGSCRSTTTCSDNRDQCMTIFFAGNQFLPPRYAKRCGTRYDCQILNSGLQGGISAICCDTDRCNR